MKSKFWKMVLVAGITILALGLVGCGGKAETVKPTDETQAIIGNIDTIGTVTKYSKDCISYIRSAYEALSNEQKSLVTNLATLEDAEKAYSEIMSADCVDKINDIGEVTLTKNTSIETARRAYDTLDEYGKTKVTNYETLVSAESTLKKLKEAEPPSKSSSSDSTSSSSGSKSSSSDSTSSSSGSKSSSSNSSSKKETGSYYNPKDGSSLYEYSDGSKEITDGYGNVGRDKDGDGKLDEISTDGGQTWKKNK
ncbi:hypothetical protein GS424_009145 [Eggerthella guodeyinii]|uniref:Lipoprotein n=1 Tax=Eggerthella guodeyinii TaxID=2690837 RepID=A0A6L7ISG9_9ACTN|nr:hypothetical protein [Eggerthella guodeyinii]QOS66732.1 hypothetical protein GS424_009145 [Eggerthella guodeyinii]